ncbi:membrane protein [Devosia soli]|uniref:Membrane protein n=1 Tax=Devosia soli TaxID=361041 RepID=A0A0F5L7D9_9HYPH|nr:DUF1190 domain-containing protein [Devosia soli]KKB78145.1 membrane protein [Devosia soli]
MRRRLSGRKPPLLSLGTIALSSMALSACAGDPPGEVLFSSVDQCITAGMDAQVCQAGYQDAMQAHLANAPRFDGLAACEAEYGAGQCTEESTSATNSGGGGSFFTPFLAGYLLSSTINNLTDYNNYRRTQINNGYAYGSTPIYRNRSGQTLTPGSRPGGDVVAPGRQTMQPVNVNTRTVVRQGFGGGGNHSFGG